MLYYHNLFDTSLVSHTSRSESGRVIRVATLDHKDYHSVRYLVSKLHHALLKPDAFIASIVSLTMWPITQTLRTSTWSSIFAFVHSPGGSRYLLPAPVSALYCGSWGLDIN